MMSCRNICRKYKAPTSGTANGGRGRYTGDAPQKYCKWCEEYIIFDGVGCPCCGRKLRYNRRTLNPDEKRYNALSRKFVVLTPELLAGLHN